MAEFTLNKRLQVTVAHEAGLDVPPTRFIEAPDDFRAALEFPVVVKSARPIANHGGALVRSKNYVCASRSELESVAHSWTPGETLLVQPLISGTGEGLFGIAGLDGVQALSAHRRIRMMNPHGSGSSACASAPVDPTLAAAAERMLTQINWRGMFMLEFLRDARGTAWFMELNGRPWGSMALARRSGLEYPAWAVRQLSDRSFAPPEVAFDGEIVCRHLGRELNHLLLVMRGPQSPGVTDWPSLYQSARAVLRFKRNEHFYNWKRGERAVFVSDTVTTVGDQIRRVFTR